MLTFTMSRTGTFVANFTSAQNQCGGEGQQIYNYTVEITIGESLDDHGFVLDNYKVQEYFDREYKHVEGARSCERIAQIAVHDFRNMLENRGRDVHSIRVTIAGSSFAGLTATWTKEPTGALVAEINRSGAVIPVDKDPNKVLTWRSEEVFPDDAMRYKFTGRPANNVVALQNVPVPPPPPAPQAPALTQAHEFVYNYPHHKFQTCRKCHKSDVYCGYSGAKCIPVAVPAAPASPVCDYCGRAVEPDTAEGNGTKWWVHSEAPKFYVCSSYEDKPYDAHATVNGSMHVPNAILCDHCHQPVESDNNVGHWNEGAQWKHVGRSYVCRSNLDLFATVNGHETVSKSQVPA